MSGSPGDPEWMTSRSTRTPCAPSTTSTARATGQPERRLLEQLTFLEEADAQAAYDAILAGDTSFDRS